MTRQSAGSSDAPEPRLARVGTDRQDDDAVALTLNGSWLVGVVPEEDTGDLVVGRWAGPDGEWHELFRVRPDWRGTDP